MQFFPFRLASLFFISALATVGTGISGEKENGHDVSLPGYAPGSTLTPERIESIANWARTRYSVPGLAVAVVRNGEVVIAGGFGVRSAATGEPVDADTVFQLASVSKTFTAAAFAKLVEQGKLAWDAPARGVLEQLRLAEAYPTEWVTGTDFLVHRAGFPGFFGDLFDNLGYSRRDVLHRIRFIQPGYSFRDHPEYSNVGFFLAGEMVASAHGTDFEQALSELILEPLGMERTGPASEWFGDDGESNVAAAHVLRDDSPAVVPHNLSKVFAAAGGLAGSANDMAAYLLALLETRSDGGDPLLGAAARDTLFQSVIAEAPGFAEFPPIGGNSGFNYSPGWGVYHYNGLKVLEKGGALDGVRTILILVPQENFGVAVLANLNLTAAPEAVRAALLQAEFGREGEADLQAAIWRQALKLEELLMQPETPPSEPGAPSLPLQAYEGTFTNDLFGQWTIERDTDDNARLRVVAGASDFAGSLTPWDGETFHLLWPGVLSAPMPLDFQSDPDGPVTAFEYGGYEFRRLGNAPAL